MGVYDGKILTVKEFREMGFIQEINRLLLHPLGLALEVTIDKETKDEAIYRIWDNRDDPEGMIYADGIIDVDKARKIQDATVRAMQLRQVELGFHIQPLPEIESVQVRRLLQNERFAWRGAVWRITERGNNYVEAVGEQFNNVQSFKEETGRHDEVSWFTYVRPMPG